MRILSLITVGVGALAFADAQAACTSPQDGAAAQVINGHSVCVHSGATGITIAANAIIGTDVHLYSNVQIGAQASIGDFTQLGSETGPGVLIIAPKVTIADSTSYETRTIVRSGTLGRRDEIGDQTEAGERLAAAADVVVGRNVDLGADVTIGYGATINDNAWLGSDVQLGNLSSVGFGAWVGDNTSIGRSTFVGNYAEVCNVDLGPDVTIGSYSSVGACDELGNATGLVAKVRRGADIGKHVSVEQGARIGRDVTLHDYATVEEFATIRSGSTVLEGGVVEDGEFIAKNTTVPGNPLNVPPEPTGTFFSAAGGKVCVEKPNPATPGTPFTPGVCHFLGMDDDGTSPRPVYSGGPACAYPDVGEGPDPRCAPDRYCLDDDQDHACDTHVAANQPAQAITITAPTTIGVSPYSYNNGSTACPTDPNGGIVQTGSAPNITCTVTVRNASYILQAGPIFVLSPPTPN